MNGASIKVVEGDLLAQDVKVIVNSLEPQHHSLVAVATTRRFWCDQKASWHRAIQGVGQIWANSIG